MRKEEFLNKLCFLGACHEATKWVSKSDLSPGKMWVNCPDPTWLFWLASELSLSAKKFIVPAVVECVSKGAIEDTTEVRQAVKDLKSWVRGRRPTQYMKDRRNAAARDMNWGLSDIYDIANHPYGAGDTICVEGKRYSRIIAKHIPWQVISKKLQRVSMQEAA